MLTSIRASRTLRHGLNVIKPTPLCMHVLGESYIKLQDARTLKLYHSIGRTQKNSDFFFPREDYTLKKDVAKANWMITKLCQEGYISEARELFEEMPERDVISWTALISGYVKCGLVKEARELFDRGDAEKNVVTWTAMMSGYWKIGRVSEAERLFDEMPDKNVVAWNTMIDGYVRSDRIKQALHVFERMEERNVVSWNIVISGLVNCGRVEEAREFFDQMPIGNVISWTILISGFARNGRVDEARLLFDRMPERNVVSWNAMISGYAQNTRLGEAYSLFEKMPVKDVQSWNTMITGFIKNGELETGWGLFNQMPGKNVISWTAMISGCVQYGKSEEALKIFYYMSRDRKVKPNEGTFVSVLGACSDLAGLSEGMQVHQVISKTVYQESEFVISALVNMYSKCGELVMARKMFDDGLGCERDLVCWNSMIAAYAHHGCGREAIMLFEDMQNVGVKPNDITYVGLLSACSHAGLVQEGLNYFEVLLRDKSIKVREDHYTCTIDLYGRAGRLQEAFDLIEQLPLKASAYAWGTLLLGCNIHGNADIGKLVADKLLDLEPANAGSYALLSNIYTTSGKWKEAEMLRLKMKDGRLKKQPGCSWIEVGNKFHVFIVGDRSHSESEAIHSLLLNLHKKMKKIGFSLFDNIVMEEIFSEDNLLI
ncbi:pentatricopeptide repeat-containing protein At2g35030, mitochondrial [Sesamum indicum]|uniref:Pentatricopeptide repeat-containing protein At2g35030, mitochondrial n=1 Tax=Sesamum indicum TaxID=4182 RepID=A0A6I9T4W0_SESIN|nr:pentatricopeptide repeat-containing protein At2g35030, mitochondrial [Sesamum indicum]XP_020548995.1 pentatricopeptide repeat-containing protein At2g35030, mitochondrial [Sesamum indicum]XP_020548996.1 pentatricopeptide repeat-containing protein At2g35030, mitochondrial [Sesamum indicum]XP_020548997.1 pentatricopeptide repeat-containing protein At2g35030, mitochondrial [Sesamum indicum]